MNATPMCAVFLFSTKSCFSAVVTFIIANSNHSSAAPQCNQNLATLRTALLMPLCVKMWGKKKSRTITVANQSRCYPLLGLSAECLHSKSVITHWVVDVVKALAGREGVVGIDAFKPTNGQEHSNRRAKSKKGLRVESQLWVINGYLWREGGVRNMT